MEEGVGRKVYNRSNLLGLLLKKTQKTKKKRWKKIQNDVCMICVIGQGIYSHRTLLARNQPILSVALQLEQLRVRQIAAAAAQGDALQQVEQIGAAAAPNDDEENKKAKWKGHHYTPRDTNEKRPADKPNMLADSEGRYLVKFWTEEQQVLSDRNIKSRSHQKAKHTMGERLGGRGSILMILMMLNLGDMTPFQPKFLIQKLKSYRDSRFFQTGLTTSTCVLGFDQPNWDDEEDGIWRPLKIPNLAYNGSWKLKKSRTPDIRGNGRLDGLITQDCR
ncbi:hypothetical protein MKW98_005833 [Papaver atlanticum]|uniref:Uncharacterized protein n=1 Tax=Papaver atlanticum TaxID=357466 RepID=A0AAD4XVU8_9MAGN|nr:hypothetical protein MKW98_005833 [Papaver atlanticum]